jgi:hypothetical protein
MALPSTSGCLGVSWYETFLRSACLGWLCQTPCSYAGYLDVSTLHTFKTNIVSLASSMIVSTTTEDFFMWCTFQYPTRYPQILYIVDLRLLWDRYACKPPWGRPCQTPCSYARRSGCLYISFDQDHDSVFFYILSIKPATLPASMLGDYSMSVSLTPSWFLRRTNLLGNPFLITSFLDLLSLPFLLDHHTGHPAHHDARILLYECIIDALWIFSSSFRSMGSLLPIGRHSTSLRLARLQTCRLLS